MIEKWEYPDVVIALLGERGVMGHSGVEDKCHCLSAMTGYGLVFGAGLWSRPNSSTPTPTPAWKNRLRLQLRLQPTSVSFFTCRQ